MSVSVYVNVIRGNSKRFDATFTDVDGLTLIDADSHIISFYDPNGNIQAAPTTPTRDSLGTYHYDYTVPATGTVGLWRIVWQMTKGSVPWGGDSFFNVTS